MSNKKVNTISKKDFLELSEENVLFITNPGRMGDEDGMTFVIREDDKYKIYRVDGWMYPTREIKEEDYISLEDAEKQFPLWLDAWKNGDNEKYKHLYMGFGNGLSVDNSIYKEFEPYLNQLVEEYLEDNSEEEKERLRFAAIYNVWEKALLKMMEENKKLVKD